MIGRRCFIRTFLGAAALSTLAPWAAFADAPPEQAVATIKSFCDALLETMKQATQLGPRGRFQKLDPVVRRAYNLPLMARLAIGPDWQKLSPDEQQQLIAAFSDYSIATYAQRFDGYSGERFEVDPKPTASSNGLLVNTKLIKSNGEAVQLNYFMRSGDAGWQIIDVYLSGTVSQLATQRSEFTSVLHRDGTAGLLQLLKQKVADALK
jgi:phospholipid transport system substrate-binding protein